MERNRRWHWLSSEKGRKRVSGSAPAVVAKNESTTLTLPYEKERRKSGALRIWTPSDTSQLFKMSLPFYVPSIFDSSLRSFGQPSARVGREKLGHGGKPSWPLQLTEGGRKHLGIDCAGRPWRAGSIDKSARITLLRQGFRKPIRDYEGLPERRGVE